MLEAVGEGGDAPVVAPHALPAVGPRQRCVRLGHVCGSAASTTSVFPAGPSARSTKCVLSGMSKPFRAKLPSRSHLRTEKRPEAGHKRRDGIIPLKLRPRKRPVFSDVR